MTPDAKIKDAHEKSATAVKIVDALKSYDVTTSAAWNDLDVLSSQTVVEAVRADPEGVIFDTPDSFSGVANIYVLLQYDPKGRDAFYDSTSFLGEFKGHLRNGDPVIDELSVDTSSFYEGQDMSALSS